MISGFEWDDDNVFHIERHEFTPDEVEEVFAGDHKVRRKGQANAPESIHRVRRNARPTSGFRRVPAIARKFGESDHGQGHGRN